MASERDTAALLALVQGPEGREWSASLKGWSAEGDGRGDLVPVCEWEGVACRSPGPGSEFDVSDGLPAIVGVQLAGRGLSGTIPTEFGLLTHLETLVLKDNVLRGGIPDEIAGLGNLQTLDLTECLLTGTLPKRFASESLSRLLLANNAISGRFFGGGGGGRGGRGRGNKKKSGRDADGMAFLGSLTEVRMENNLLTGTLSGGTLSRMTSLTTLSLSDNDLSGTIPGEELGGLASLHYLYLDGNHLMGPLPEKLARAEGASLLELWVQGNALSGTVPSSYVRFTGLHDFYIDGNKLTGAVPPAMCGPEVNADFFDAVPPGVERNYCDSIACPAGSVAAEGVYPCEPCPGGEAARLMNRYLGQSGKCSDYGQRDVLRIFYEATTKSGPWEGTNDWADGGEGASDDDVCNLSGVGCDGRGHVVSIDVRGRGLTGRLPDELGFLPFLESLDVSDNGLMGYLPSDLVWTSIERLDVSGNMIRGAVPPLLCMEDELNGNGAGGVYSCDRVACPAGTYGTRGRRAGGADGEDPSDCRPCYDGSPYLGRKECGRTVPPGSVDWKGKAGEARDYVERRTGRSAGAVLAVFACMLAILALAFRCAGRAGRARPKRADYEKGAADEGGSGDGSDSDGSSSSGSSGSSEEDEDEEDHLSYLDATPAGAGGDDSLPLYERDHYSAHFSIDGGDDDDGRDGGGGLGPVLPNGSSHSSAADADDVRSLASAHELIRGHRGIALRPMERLTRAVSEHLPGDSARRAREALQSSMSRVNVSARQYKSRRSRLDHERIVARAGDYYSGEHDEDLYEFEDDRDGGVGGDAPGAEDVEAVPAAPAAAPPQARGPGIASPSPARRRGGATAAGGDAPATPGGRSPVRAASSGPPQAGVPDGVASPGGAFATTPGGVPRDPAGGDGMKGTGEDDDDAAAETTSVVHSDLLDVPQIS